MSNTQKKSIDMTSTFEEWEDVLKFFTVFSKQQKNLGGWISRTEYVSKTGFKIEKDKITFPNGLRYTFEEFTKHYNQLRGVYRKLSELKKDKIF